MSAAVEGAFIADEAARPGQYLRRIVRTAKGAGWRPGRAYREVQRAQGAVFSGGLVMGRT
jgi:hypothetical protein